MFTGLITGVGTVRAVTPIGDGKDARFTIAMPDNADWAGRRHQARRLHRLFRLLPDRGRAGRGFLRGRGLGRNAVADHARRLAARAAKSTSKARCGWATSWAGISSPAMSTGWPRSSSATPENGSTRWLFRARRAGPLRRAERQHRDQRRVAHRQRGANGTARIRRQHHPAHRGRIPISRHWRSGDRVNIEIDMLARYVARQLSFQTCVNYLSVISSRPAAIGRRP